jgi:glycosyltransferase involved in cell wall biosynthesis
MRYFRSAADRARSRLQAIFAYRLGRLVQFQPRHLTLPAHYYRPIRLRNVAKISVVTPSFRQACFIERTLRSLLDQGYPNLEYVVQDGGSQDGTVEILQRYADRLASWESRPDGGQSQALNLGFARTSGEIMAWLNSDDVLLPGTLAYVADYLSRHPEVDVVYGHRVTIDEQDHQIGRWMLPPHDDQVLSWADYIPQETLFWRRRIWDKVGGRIDESFRFAMDWDLILRFRAAGARFARLPRFMGAFRIHTAQKTSAEISSTGMQEMTRLRERILGRVPPDDEVWSAVRPYLRRHVVTDLLWRVRRSLGVPT